MTAKKTLIDSWDEVPDFASEAEEQAWWERHDLSERFLADAATRERERRRHGAPSTRPADILAGLRERAGQQSASRD
jgi:hypothetical protein